MRMDDIAFKGVVDNLIPLQIHVQLISQWYK